MRTGAARRGGSPRTVRAAFGAAGLVVVAMLLLADVPGLAAPVPTATPPNGPPGQGLLPLYVHETGLPAKQPWNVVIQQNRYTVNNSTLTVKESPGFYFIQIAPVNLYQPNQSAGTVQVGPGPGYFNVTFAYNKSVIQSANNSTNTPDNNTTGLFGLSPTQGDILIVVLVLAVIAAASMVFITTRRRRRARSAPAKDDESEDKGGPPPPARSKPRPTKDERRRAQRRRERRESAKKAPPDDG